MTGLRIVRLANFVAPSSGGLRTALRELGAGYLAAGHDPVLVVPGETVSDVRTAQGRVITLPGHRVPGTGGYRVLTDRRRLARLLESLAPDRLEVSDRTTLRWTGEWARRHRVRAVMVSHESVDGVMATWGVPANWCRRAADELNRRTAYSFTRVVCTTAWAAREFHRVGARNVVRAPLGVDLRRCHPGLRDPRLHAQLTGGDDRVLLALCSRLSPEKRPGLALDALAELRRRGVPATLVVAGDGPLRGRLLERATAARLPVVFHGHVGDPADLAVLQATADIVLAPGPAETFGLAAMEALACGTPVVANARSAVPALLGPAGTTAHHGTAFADGVQRLLARPAATRRATARARAEEFPWSAAVDAFLAALDAPAVARPAPRPVPAAEGGPR
ncbi:glycosyltransferase [Streptomyces sp. 8K308]|uniref:glycosyltransferase n=1 Tax=Streptomyces sp. 8K308 TaxID=2530388 RepID=UPI0010494603|nr:glycosyltransferase [Streptomyces sp. 8K308]TDC08377.1 glycosyltransferase [Streptomyces sp. 8K308]